MPLVAQRGIPGTNSPRCSLPQGASCFNQAGVRRPDNRTTPVTGHELRGAGRVYGGGLHKIEPGELGRVSAALLVERWLELAQSVQREETVRLFG
jgi:hypothetical protein